MLDKVKVYAERLRGVDLGALPGKMQRIKNLSPGHPLLTWLDLIYCVWRYKAGFNEYIDFKFYQLTAAQRKTYHTVIANAWLISQINDASKLYLLRGKGLFLSRFSDYVKRDFLDLRKADQEEFYHFLQKHDRFVVKAYNLAAGRGVEVYETPADGGAGLYTRLMESEKYIIEEYISQHRDLSRIYPGCVNSIRICTLNCGEAVQPVLMPSIRFGARGGKIDFEGALQALIDLETGRIMTGALGPDHEYYPAHPDSGVAFTGYEIPFFHAALELVIKAAREIPEIRYFGWDIAISADGPVIIEANGAPGFEHLQHFSARMNNGIGVKAIFQQLTSS